MNIKEAIAITGSDLGEPSKMPGYSFGLPARACKTGSRLQGVVGSTCSDCYAMKGNYIFPSVQQSEYNRLKGIDHPQWIEAMTVLIQRKMTAPDRDGRYFRWHDSGDLQSVQHLENIAEIARRLPKVKFWLPTREYQIVREWFASGAIKPTNLNIRLSGHMVDGPLPTKLAAQYGLTVSGVHSDHDQTYGGAIECKAYTRGNDCGSCRACWKQSVPAVSYLKH
jgi:hypothetical protein